jgi:hypothetical protein
LIYIRPRYLTNRRNEPNATRWTALVEALWYPSGKSNTSSVVRPKKTRGRFGFPKQHRSEFLQHRSEFLQVIVNDASNLNNAGRNQLCDIPTREACLSDETWIVFDDKVKQSRANDMMVNDAQEVSGVESIPHSPFGQVSIATD